jgi:hypothetical protein
LFAFFNIDGISAIIEFTKFAGSCFGIGVSIPRIFFQPNTKSAGVDKRDSTLAFKKNNFSKGKFW